MRRQVSEALPLKALVLLTHNLFRYDEPGDFRRQTMIGMIECLDRCATSIGVELVGATLERTARAYRDAVPLGAPQK